MTQNDVVSAERLVCTIGGNPMPAGEEAFKFHGYSGPCPLPAGKETYVDEFGSTVIHDGRPIDEGEEHFDAAEARIAVLERALESAVAILRGEVGSGWAERNQHDWEIIDIALSAMPISRRSTDGEAVAWMHILGAIWRADNCPAGMDFTDEGWVPLYTHPTPTKPVAAPSGLVVTAEMVSVARDAWKACEGNNAEAMRTALTAALSIEVSL